MCATVSGAAAPSISACSRRRRQSEFSLGVSSAQRSARLEVIGVDEHVVRPADHADRRPEALRVDEGAAPIGDQEIARRRPRRAKRRGQRGLCAGLAQGEAREQVARQPLAPARRVVDEVRADAHARLVQAVVADQARRGVHEAGRRALRILAHDDAELLDERARGRRSGRRARRRSPCAGRRPRRSCTRGVGAARRVLRARSTSARAWSRQQLRRGRARRRAPCPRSPPTGTARASRSARGTPRPPRARRGAWRPSPRRRGGSTPPRDRR